MYGPYPAFSFNDTGQLDVATGTLYWVQSSTYNGTDTYSVVISYIGRDIVLHTVTCSVFVTNGIGNGAPTGRLLRDPGSGDFFICIENGYGYSTWQQFDKTGALISNLGLIGFSTGPLSLCQDACLDGLGNLIHTTAMGASVSVVSTSPLTVVGNVALTYSGSSRVTVGASNQVWILSTDGSNGAIDQLTIAGPTITPFSLGAGGAFVAYTIEYDATDDTLLFWWNSLINKWSCSTHAIVNSISSITYDISGPLQAGLLNSGLGFYDASSLALTPITAAGFNPGLPPIYDGSGFKHFYDSGLQVIWLQANDTNVYGAILGGFPLLTTCISATLPLNVPFSATLTATGGTPPYTFAIISGSLPPLLQLNALTGAITGVPTVPGAYPYTSQVTDSLGVTAINSCVLIVPLIVVETNPIPSVEVTRDLDSEWKDSSVFYITQDDPFPFTLRGLVQRMSYNQD